MKLGNQKEVAKEVEDPRRKKVEDLRLDSTSQPQEPGGGPEPKKRSSSYPFISMKMLHIRPPSHSSVSPSQKSDTSADSSDSSSDGIPAKHTSRGSSRNLLRLLKPLSPPRPPVPEPRIENIHSPGLPETITSLLTAHGLPTHAGFIDSSFSIYLPPASFPATAPDYAISFKQCHGVAVVYGDPLCSPDRLVSVFDSFCAYSKRRKWRVAVIGASSRLVDHAVKRGGWGAMEFAVASVLNPTTDVIAAGKGFQTIRRDNRRLASAGWKVEVYDPSSESGRVLELEAELSGLYKEWREERNARGVPQTYSTVLEPWLVPGACRHLYVRSPETGKVAGLATMLRCGGVEGYLLDPLLAVAGSPRGVTEILTTHALQLLQEEGATYLTFGFAPMMALNSILNIPQIVEKPARVCYAVLQQHLGLGGKRIWHEKWRPERSEGTWLLFPPTGVRGYVTVTRALCGVTHIRFKDVVGATKGAGFKDVVGAPKGGEGSKAKGNSAKEHGGEQKGDHKQQQQQQGGTGRKLEVKGVRNSCIRWASTSCINWPSRTLRSIQAPPVPVANGESKSSGESRAARVNGETHALQANGESHAPQANGELHAPQANGELHAPKANGELHAPKANGELHAPKANGELRIRKANGEASVRNTNGESSMRKANGDSPAGKANGDSHAGKANGDSQAGKANGGSHAGKAKRESHARKANGIAQAGQANGDSHAGKASRESHARMANGVTHAGLANGVTHA